MRNVKKFEWELDRKITGLNFVNLIQHELTYLKAVIQKRAFTFAGNIPLPIA